MNREERRERRFLVVFSAICLLVLAQVGWWTYVLLSETQRVEQLSSESVRLKNLTEEATAAEISQFQKVTYHRRVMFLSEALTFALLSLVGFYFIYRGYRKEQASRKVQRNFIEMFSHESKTPLTVLQLQLESLREKHPSEGAGLETALFQVHRLSNILEKTLNLNRAERDALHFEPVALADLVNEVRRRLSSWLSDRSVKFEFKMEDEGWVQGDIHGLQSVVQSLVENAVLYNPAISPTVVLHLRRERNAVSLSVEDDGPGIPADEVNKIFQRFFRGRQRGSVSGTGLGLYLAKYIVESHKGFIRWLMPSSGRGSRFEIQLPAFEGV